MTRSEAIAYGKTLKAAITTVGVWVEVSKGKVRYGFYARDARRVYRATEAEAAAAMAADNAK